jgi:hypothetical protein
VQHIKSATLPFFDSRYRFQQFLKIVVDLSTRSNEVYVGLLASTQLATVHGFV